MERDARVAGAVRGECGHRGRGSGALRRRRGASTSLRSSAPRAVAITLALNLPWLAGCATSTSPPEGPAFTFDFRSDTAGWRAAFADYPEGREADVGFVAGVRPLPGPLPPGDALYHRGDNISDDLFMYFDRRVTGLRPGAVYRVTFRLEYASNYGDDCTIGVGSLVYLKAGASTIEPAGAPDGRGVVRLNVDKGEQMNGGANAVLLGDVRNGEPGCDENAPFAAAAREADAFITVRADDSGGIWLFFGSESAFESAHELYFTGFVARLEREGVRGGGFRAAFDPAATGTPSSPPPPGTPPPPR